MRIPTEQCPKSLVNSVLFSLFIMEFFLYFNTLLCFGKTSFPVAMHFDISVSHTLFSFKTLLRYLSCCTRLLLLCPICNLHVRLSLLLTTIHYVLLQIMFNTSFSVSFTNFCRRSCSFLSVYLINVVS